LLEAAEQKIKKTLGRCRPRHCDCDGDHAAEHSQAPGGVTAVRAAAKAPASRLQTAIAPDDHADVNPGREMLRTCCGTLP